MANPDAMMSNREDEVSLFDDEFLKKLEHLSMISRRLSAGTMRSVRRTKKRGTGLEFYGHRPYVSGDDFRHLDWMAYLRLNRLILKLFEEEEDLPIYLFVDASLSMTFGSPTKLDYARRVVAALCYIGLANLDRIHVVSVANGTKVELPSQRGKGRIFNICRFLSEIAPNGTTDLKTSFKACCTDKQRRGLAVVISDLLDENCESALDVLRYFRHDVFVLHVASHEEVDPTAEGEVFFVDSEGHRGLELTMSPSLATAYRNEYRKHCDAIESYCGRHQFGYLRTVTDLPFEELVLKVFRQGRFLK